MTHNNHTCFGDTDFFEYYPRANHGCSCPNCDIPTLFEKNIQEKYEKLKTNIKTTSTFILFIPVIFSDMVVGLIFWIIGALIYVFFELEGKDKFVKNFINSKQLHVKFDKNFGKVNCIIYEDSTHDEFKKYRYKRTSKCFYKLTNFVKYDIWTYFLYKHPYAQEILNNIKECDEITIDPENTAYFKVINDKLNEAFEVSGKKYNCYMNTNENTYYFIKI